MRKRKQNYKIVKIIILFVSQSLASLEPMVHQRGCLAVMLQGTTVYDCTIGMFK